MKYTCPIDRNHDPLSTKSQEECIVCNLIGFVHSIWLSPSDDYGMARIDDFRDIAQDILQEFEEEGGIK